MADEVLRKQLLDELKIVNGLEAEGVNFAPSIFNEYFSEHPEDALFHYCMDNSYEDTTKFHVPAEIRVGHGFGSQVQTNFKSPYKLIKEGSEFFVTKNEEVLAPFSISKAWVSYGKKTSDGVRFGSFLTTGNLKYGEGVAFVAYSDECALLQRGKDCLFCNINATKRRFGDLEQHQWKYPKQIGEAVKQAFADGADHFNITGGFVPERRELEYYIDVAEAIQEATGREDFNGTAVIGAPEDLKVLEQYKEAGYKTIAIHPEVWGENWFNAICPGKAEVGGGFHHYLDAVDAALEIFGKGRVRTQFVAGLQPKNELYDGLEYFAERGVVALSLAWIPNIGSALEGQRSPTEEWHWEVVNKNYEILRKNGITYDILYDSLPNRRVLGDLFRINDHIDKGTPLFEDKRVQK